MVKLLIVDDRETILNSCVDRLKLSTVDYNIDKATSPEEAINKLSSTQYDVVVTDLRMPSDSYEGFKVIREIKKKDPNFDNTKVIVLTVVGLQDPRKGISAIRLALQLGVSDYIIKERTQNYLEILDLAIQRALRWQKISIINEGQVFVVSPYDKHHDQLYDELEKRIENTPFFVIRADKNYRGDYLKEVIYSDIAESEYVIAFVRDLNSNVMYELGLAHGMQKKVIIVKDEQTVLNSDLKGIQYISYDRDAYLNLIDDIFEALNNFTPDI